jgi:D-glycero-D-manno-heptose 1,7-bisphosphate phosphatase
MQTADTSAPAKDVPGKRRAIFLDRDGVLNAVVLRNGKPHPPESLHALQILPGVDGACAQLRHAGFLLVVVTNQPDIARGTQQLAVVEQMNSYLRERLHLDDVLVCPHDDGDACDCRKPRPGLLLQAARKWGIDLARSYMIGDRWRDIDAGKLAGCSTIHVQARYDEPGPLDPDIVVTTLQAAVREILCRQE